MVTSFEESFAFRTLQAIHDLKCVALAASDETLKRIGAGVSQGNGVAGLRRLIFEQGCRLTAGDANTFSTTLLLAATLPDDDHAAFVTSTAVLLADRLQLGAGQDDLYWHWDAFQKYYQLVEPTGRAAIFQGYLCAHKNGRVHLAVPPKSAESTTLPVREVIDRLESLAAGKDRELALSLIEALFGGDTHDATKAWVEGRAFVLGTEQAHDRNVISAFRHLFETNEVWDPYFGSVFSLLDETPRIIPVVPE